MCRHHEQDHCNLTPIPQPLYNKLFNYVALIKPLLFLLVLNTIINATFLLAARHSSLLDPAHLLPFKLSLVVIFLSFLSFRIFLFPAALSGQDFPARADSEAFKTEIQSKSNRMVNNLSRAIQCKTISYDRDDLVNKIDFSQFERLLDHIEESFPLVHRKLNRTIINKYSLVFEWKGTDLHAKPILLAAHLDVVPAADTQLWTHPAFSGAIINHEKTGKPEWVWGRGAIDFKQNVFAILECIELLLQHNHSPKHSFYLAFGADEEIGGYTGAQYISRHFADRNISFEFMLDEGLFILSDIIKGYSKPIAMVCIAEKGYCNVDLNVTLSAAEAGHSSTPNTTSSIGILSSALTKLEKHKMPVYFGSGPEKELFSALAPGFDSFLTRLIMCNLWLFGGIVAQIFAANYKTAATVRSTTALTIVNAGTKANVIPRTATAKINHRIHPFDSVEGIIEHDKAVINDPRVSVRAYEELPPAKISSTANPAYKLLERSILQCFPDVTVVPSLMVGNTDTRWFWERCQDIYRFTPIRLQANETQMFHGVNERIKVDNYLAIVHFYQTLIKNADDRIGSSQQQKKQQ
jgi:carboxypeptidase PM20D1